MSSDEVYGLTLPQHRLVEEMMVEHRRRSQPSPRVNPREKQYLAPVRVIALTDRTYDSKTFQSLPYFIWQRDRTVFTVEFTGSTLSGYLAVTINGTRFVVECRRESLSDLEAVFPRLRATVLPGLWEFDFGYPSSAVTLAVSAITADENTSICALYDDLDSAIFSGSTIVREEYWVTEPEVELNLSPAVKRVDVRDCIPYSAGAVAAGAIGIADWRWDSGFIASAWQCRTFSFATGYVQTDDPVFNPPPEEENNGGGGGGGGGPTGPEEPPPLGP